MYYNLRHCFIALFTILFVIPVFPAKDQVDIAPSRENLRSSPKPSPSLKKRDTMERQELEAGDKFPSIGDGGMKMVRNHKGNIIFNL